MESTAALAAASSDVTREPLAPWWHTVLVLLPIAIGSVASWYQQGLEHISLPGISLRASSYLTILVEEWFVVLLIYLALKRRRLSIISLVSGRWHTVGAFFRDLGLGIAFIVVIVPLTSIAVHILKAGNTANTLARITPKTPLELVLFLAMAATAGFCEELVFRGYLTQQFSAWTGSRLLAVVLQAAVFGLAHGYYYSAMAVVMIEGFLLGLLAYWRRSLRPGMLAHGLQDSLGGVVSFLTSR
jgi:uncharacterized protein